VHFASSPCLAEVLAVLVAASVAQAVASTALVMPNFTGAYCGYLQISNPTKSQNINVLI